QQATGGPTSLGFTSEERANPQSASGHDVALDSTAEVDPGLSAPNDSIPLQQDQTKSVSEGLETVLTQPTTKKGASLTAIHGDKEEASTSINDDLVIIIDESDEDEPNAKTEDTSVPNSSSPRSSQIQELTNLVLILQSQKHKLELEKNKVEAEAALLKAQPLFPDRSIHNTSAHYNSN
ncbi:hypothetical protein Tco_0043221, partial [Tanacetum coccineum]